MDGLYCKIDLSRQDDAIFDAIEEISTLEDDND